MRKSCSRCGFLIVLQTSQVLPISMNAQLTLAPIVLKHFQGDNLIVSSRHLFAALSACTMGYEAHRLGQLDLITCIY